MAIVRSKTKKKPAKLVQAEKIVELQERVEFYEDKLSRYSHKGLDGKRWNIDRINDSLHFDARYMITMLPPEEREAINRYIVGKFKKAIKDAKEELVNMGVK